MEKLIGQYDFVNLAQADNDIDWSKINIVKL